ERITADSNKNTLQNGTIWSAYTEIIDTEFCYPNTALAGVSFDSDYFNGIPARNYLVRGIKVKVPSNYNPETRAYTGLWDGTFKIAWSDNPAWVLMDVITNERYGLGGLLGSFSCDKWMLYDIARYCDTMVDDGFGGKEPRFTCNAWITDISDAYTLLNNICSIFRAIPVWTGQEYSAIMDRPSDPAWTYTNANVINGIFERSYSAKKSRHNAVKVTYSDKNNAYQSAVEYVSDDESIAKNGLNLTEITAFGCTSRGQAYRTGRWLIETEKLEKETITFTVGREGLMHLPGDIIRVSDNHYAGLNIGGRVVSIDGNKVTLDREVKISGTTNLTYINKNAQESTIRITAANGNVVTLASTPNDIEPMTIWSLSTST
ncbi:host specificity protein J, partial [Basfia succiniciproducens]|uniref:host specificity protein J n=1 Tax=Basfia succiniciproducens TaxID=653940 RepID=UPI00115FEC87